MYRPKLSEVPVALYIHNNGGADPEEAAPTPDLSFEAPKFECLGTYLIKRLGVIAPEVHYEDPAGDEVSNAHWL